MIVLCYPRNPNLFAAPTHSCIHCNMACIKCCCLALQIVHDHWTTPSMHIAEMHTPVHCVNVHIMYVCMHIQLSHTCTPCMWNIQLTHTMHSRRGQFPSCWKSHIMHMYMYSLHAHEQCMHDAQPGTDLALEDMHWQGPRILALSTPAHITNRLTDNACVDNTCQLRESCIYVLGQQRPSVCRELGLDETRKSAQSSCYAQ